MVERAGGMLRLLGQVNWPNSLTVETPSWPIGLYRDADDAPDQFEALRSKLSAARILADLAQHDDEVRLCMHYSQPCR